MKEETTSKQVNIQLPPTPEPEPEPEDYYGSYGTGSSASHVLRQALVESKEPYHPKPITPKDPSAAPLVLGVLLFLISLAGLISVGLWYAWPSIQKYTERWTPDATTPLHDTDDTAAIQKLIAPAAPKVTYYHVSCVAQLETGRINFHEFHYSLADGEPVNPLLLIHNLRHHAAQLTGSSNVIILAVSTLPGGGK